jgi:hypothetical protein
VHHAACAHVAANVPNLYLLETIRYNYRHVFPQLVEGLPDVRLVEAGDDEVALPAGGAGASGYEGPGLARGPAPAGGGPAAGRRAFLDLPAGPGLGIRLRDDVLAHPELRRRVTTAAAP